MCGFLAVYHGGPRPIARHSMLAGLTAIRHRGPDEHDVWIDPQAGVALGHTRLSIIGLDNGRQPIASQDGTVQLIVNGEFYDFERIRAELQARGCVFRTESDSEIALHLYREFGTAGLERLRGEFALVLYDAAEMQLVAMRDRFGIKPLFVAEHDGGLYVGSEIKAILAAGVPAVWDEDSYVSRGFYLGNRTLFRQVRSLAPGHILTVSPGHVRERAYWDLDFATAGALAASPLSEAEAVEGLREAVLEAVGLRLRADVPIAVYLSGGIDSSAMLGCATHLRGDPVHRSMYLWAKSFLPNFVLTTLGDRMEMANSIEGRVPLLDHHVAEYAARIPIPLKIRGATEKHVFREAMQPFLPDALYRRKKHYFRAPPATPKRQDRLSQLVRDTLASRTLDSIPFFDAQAVRKAFAASAELSPARQALLDPMFTEITSLCLMQSRFGLSSGTGPSTDRVMEVAA